MTMTMIVIIGITNIIIILNNHHYYYIEGWAAVSSSHLHTVCCRCTHHSWVFYRAQVGHA